MDTAKAWDLQFRQLERGNLNSRLRQVIFPEFQLGYCRLDKQIDQLGTAPPGYWTFAFAGGTRIIWRGVLKEQGDIIVYSPGSEINCQSWAGFNVITFSITEAKIEEICERHHLGGLMHTIRGNDLIRVNNLAAQIFRRDLISILQYYFEGAAQTSQPLYRMVCEELPLRLLEMIEGPAIRRKIFASSLRETAVRQVMDFLRHMDRDSVTIKDLCEVAGVSERTLQYAFREKYGMSPKQYLKAFLLNKVHAALSTSNPANAKVVDLASKWGFWHMGQFSSDYKRMFGQLPSQTLGRLYR
jgi:AraC-like DNA-binding protein